MKLVNDKIVINPNSRNLKHYLSKGYDIKINEKIEVEIKDIPTGSDILIKVYCDFCDNIKDISWSRYYKKYKKYDYYCCNKCKSVQTKKTNLKKYGSTTPLGNKDILRKVQDTNLKKYGNVCTLHNEDIKEKVKETFMFKWGGDIGSHMQNSDILNKITETNLERYNTNHPLQNKDVLDKLKRSNLEKYGVENVGQIEEIKLKIKNTQFENYGSFYFQSKEFKELDTSYRYNNSKFYDKHYEKEKDRFKDNAIEYLGNSIWRLECNKGHIYEINSDLYNSRNVNNITTCTECVPLNYAYASLKEKELLNIIYPHFNDVTNIRIDNKEIDIYIPSKKIGFEFNGLYWHSDIFKEKKYHFNKTELCKDNDIELIHIWEDEWIYKQDILLSFIYNKLGLIKNKIYARKCDIRIVNSKQKNYFLENNHLQGKCKSSINYGLYFNDELVSLMTFYKRRINSKEEFELVRFCNCLNTSVIGGASKLFKHFLKSNPSIEQVTSYSDNSKYDGQMYSTLGFENISTNVLNYYWTDLNQRYHRFIFNKKKLIKEGYNPNKTENEIMRERGFYKIWGCGHNKWVYTLGCK